MSQNLDDDQPQGIAELDPIFTAAQDAPQPMHANGIEWGITPDQQMVFLTAVTEGAYFKTACLIAGISYYTFREWMLKGGDPQSNHSLKIPEDQAQEPYKSFAFAVRRAEADGEHKATAAVRAQWSKDWKAAAWFLARRHSKNWGDQRGEQAVQVTTDGKVTILMPTNNRGDSSETGDPEVEETKEVMTGDAIYDE